MNNNKNPRHAIVIDRSSINVKHPYKRRDALINSWDKNYNQIVTDNFPIIAIDKIEGFHKLNERIRDDLKSGNKLLLILNVDNNFGDTRDDDIITNYKNTVILPVLNIKDDNLHVIVYTGSDETRFYGLTEKKNSRFIDYVTSDHPFECIKEAAEQLLPIKNTSLSTESKPPVYAAVFTGKSIGTFEKNEIIATFSRHSDSLLFAKAFLEDADDGFDIQVYQGVRPDQAAGDILQEPSNYIETLTDKTKDGWKKNKREMMELNSADEITGVFTNDEAENEDNNAGFSP